MPAAVMISLANDLEPSIIAAARSGPKQLKPAARSASPTPAISGASGPTTTRSAAVFAASSVTAAGSAGADVMQLGMLGDAGIARSGVQLGHVAVPGQGTGQRMLAAA